MKKVARVLFRVLAIITALLLLVIALVQVPFIQNKIKEKVLSQVNTQLRVPISIEHISLTFFDHLVVDGVYWGTESDTLAYIHELSVDIQLFDLFRHKVHLNEVGLEGVKANVIKLGSDSTLNLVSALMLSASDTSAQDTSATAMAFGIDRVYLRNIKASYRDEVDSMSLAAKIKDLDLKVGELDFEQNSYGIHSLQLDGLWLDMKQAKQSESEVDTSIVEDSALPFQLKLEKAIELNNLNVYFSNKASGQDILVQRACLHLTSDQIDLPKQLVYLKKLDVQNARVDIANHLPAAGSDKVGQDEFTEPFSLSALGWYIKVQELNFANNSFCYSAYNNELKQTSEVFRVDSLQSQWTQVNIDSALVAAEVAHLAMVINQKTTLPETAIKFQISDEAAHVQLQSTIQNTSHLNVEAQLHYNSFQRLQDSIGQCVLSCQLDAALQGKDLAAYIPDLDSHLKNANLSIQTDAEGNLNHLLLQKFNLSVAKAIDLQMRGHVFDVMDMEKVRGSVELQKLQLSTHKLMPYLPDSIIPNNISLPDSIDLTGRADGSVQKLNVNLKLKSSLGHLETQVSLDRDSIPGKEYYTAQLSMDSLNLGQILQKPDTLQYVTLLASGHGETTHFKDPHFDVQATFSHLGLLHYNYQNLQIDGQVAGAYFNGNIAINDPNVAFLFKGELDNSDTIPHMNADLQLDYIHMGALHLMDDSTSLSTHLNVDLEGKEWNRLKGKMKVDGFHYESGESSMVLDSLNLRMLQLGDSALYSLKTYELYWQDSLLNKGLSFNAKIKGNEALFAYKVLSKSHTKKDTLALVLDGKGDFYMAADSMLLNTSLRWFQKKLPEPLQLQIQASKSNDKQLRFSAEGDKIRLNAATNLSVAQDEVSASVSIDSLDFSLIEPLTGSLFNKLQGHLNGQVAMKGKKDSPEINGSVTIRQATVNPTAVNTDFHIAEGTVAVDNNLFHLQEIPIVDVNGNKAILSGELDINDLQNPVFALQFKAHQFLLINQKEGTADNYFGKVMADIDAKINGSKNNPDIQLDVAFNNQSDFTYVMSSESAKASNQNGVVLFLTDTLAQSAQDSVFNSINSSFMGMNVLTNIGVSDSLDVTLVIDPASSEKLNIVGNGDLSFAIDPSGKQTLSGQYTIEKGWYTMRLYGVIKRDFSIEKNSFLRWTGDPLDADADLTAIYTVKTSASSLLETVQGQASDASGNNSRINVNVIMKLSGELLAPDIKFELDLDKTTTNSVLESAINQLNNDESELNKQVFSLLILNRFTGSNMSMANSMSYEIENTARQTLSSLLSQQLNNFSSQYLKGVDVTFDIQSYNQSVEDRESARTDFSVGVSQKLFNDRLKVTVGGNVAVQENDEQDNSSSGDLTGDFEVEYKLTKDGTYRLKAFNNTEYEDKFNSDVTQTGLSFLIRKDFARFRDLFRKDDKEKTEALEEK